MYVHTHMLARFGGAPRGAREAQPGPDLHVLGVVVPRGGRIGVFMYVYICVYIYIYIYIYVYTHIYVDIPTYTSITIIIIIKRRGLPVLSPRFHTYILWIDRSRFPDVNLYCA